LAVLDLSLIDLLPITIRNIADLKLIKKLKKEAKKWEKKCKAMTKKLKAKK
jgi:hypothetical protein